MIHFRNNSILVVEMSNKIRSVIFFFSRAKLHKLIKIKYDALFSPSCVPSYINQ